MDTKLPDDLPKRQFPGRDKFLADITPDLAAAQRDLRSCAELSERCSRFLDRTKPDTPHKQYARSTFAAIQAMLDETPDAMCALFEYAISPNVIWRVYFAPELNKVIGAIKAYDVGKTPLEEWHAIWGPDPPLQR